MIKNIKIIAKERECKANGNKFIAFSAVQKDGNLIDCKFRKEVKGLPQETGKYILTVDSDALNISRAKEYPVLWVKEIVKIESVAEAKSEKAQAYIDEMFGDDAPNFEPDFM